MRARLLAILLAAGLGEGVKVHGPRDPSLRLPNTLSVGIPGVEARVLLERVGRMPPCCSSCGRSVACLRRGNAFGAGAVDRQQDAEPCALLGGSRSVEVTPHGESHPIYDNPNTRRPSFRRLLTISCPSLEVGCARARLRVEGSPEIRKERIPVCNLGEWMNLPASPEIPRICLLPACPVQRSVVGNGGGVCRIRMPRRRVDDIGGAASDGSRQADGVRHAPTFGWKVR